MPRCRDEFGMIILVSLIIAKMVSRASLESVEAFQLIPSSCRRRDSQTRIPNCVMENSLVHDRDHLLRCLSREPTKGLTDKPKGLCLNAKRKKIGDTTENQSQKKAPIVQKSTANDTDVFIRFSRTFQRHVVYKSIRPSKHRQPKQEKLLEIMVACMEAIESFLFLDEALEAYPMAKLVKLRDVGACCDQEDFESVLSGMGTISSSEMLSVISSDTATFTELPDIGRGSKRIDGILSDPKAPGYTTLFYLASIATGNQQRTLSRTDKARSLREQIAMALVSRISQRRLASHTLEGVQKNYAEVMDLLTCGRVHTCSHFENAVNGTEHFVSDATHRCGLGFSEAGARSVISNFPQLCLYDIYDLEQLIKFMLAPMPPDVTWCDSQESRKSKIDVDWGRLAGEGWGANISVRQATNAIGAIPQLLALYHEDARKPSIWHMYQRLQVPSKLVDEARLELAEQLTGSDASDFCAFAYMRMLGIDWVQIKVLIAALPTLTFFDVEPSWELLEKGPVRSEFNELALHYLRKRLQTGTGQVLGMMKTHSRLSGYGVTYNILPTLHALQSRVGLSTRELRKVILRMPSLIGMSVHGSLSLSALDKRIHFFLNEANMTKLEMKNAVLTQPSLLHYSVESSLSPKLNFLTSELSLSKSVTGKVISAAPSLMGLSLTNNLQPTVCSIMSHCNLSAQEVGALVSKCPSILTLSLKRKIEPCLAFLSSALSISTADELGLIIRITPRVLLQNVESSLAPKFRILQDALEHESRMRGHLIDSTRSAKATALILRLNPALLVTTNAILTLRLETYLQNSDVTIEQAMQPRGSGRKQRLSFDNTTDVTGDQRISVKRKRRFVVELTATTKEVVNMFLSVEDAAHKTKVSTSSMYIACGQGKSLKERFFEYADVNSTLIRSIASAPLMLERVSLPKVQQYRDALVQTEAIARELCIDRVRIFGSFVTKKRTLGIKVRVCAFVSGKTYPSDDINMVRGMRKAGGIAIHFPQVLMEEKLSDKLRLAAKSSFGMIMPEEEGGSNYTVGAILAGFPFLRPSRNRCGLYACHGALKAILQLLKQTANSIDLRDADVEIEIFTDSSYAWSLLKDETRVSRWGAVPTIKQFVFDGEGPAASANSDLLFPLSKTFRKCITGDIKTQDGAHLTIGKNVNIKFRHSADALVESTTGGYIACINALAKKAAVWQYNRSKQ